MTSIFAFAKEKIAYKVVMVSALAVVGAAGFGAAPAAAHSNYNGHGNNYDKNSVKRLNADQTSINATKAKYSEHTKYVYYEHTVNAEVQTYNFDNRSLNLYSKDHISKNFHNWPKNFKWDY